MSFFASLGSLRNEAKVSVKPSCSTLLVMLRLATSSPRFPFLLFKNLYRCDNRLFAFLSPHTRGYPGRHRQSYYCSAEASGLVGSGSVVSSKSRSQDSVNSSSVPL